ncbi:GNAT family N-acetyltransferase [Pararhodobacter oceanensis]|uniref:GNAT family N-acetyltransferase n=1 Tax=Pararhodobacter oceanensis TaxID=2172121 RepID=A0A2T8HT75_9RHOB|nr:GNAT family N-acetyltransferase [Pararhodobacter oceanensis]PVH28621.1 GNAT family N-acetyltransferase [Pararhodobacter oceanensis]
MNCPSLILPDPRIHRLTLADLPRLCATPAGLFDNPIDPEQAEAFLRNPLHLMLAMLEGEIILAFASGTILLHPDKPPGLFINEVGTRPAHRRRGYAKALVKALIAQANAQGCTTAWLGTEPDNLPARALYQSLDAQEESFIGYAWGGAFDA